MVSVIIPTRSERENLQTLITRLAGTIRTMAQPVEILIVDGGSQDGTPERARMLFQQHGVTGCVIDQPRSTGLAENVIEGARRAQGRWAVVMDADLSHPPELLPKLVEAVQGDAEIAVASRYVAGGGTEDWPLHRRWLSRLGNGLAWPLCHVHDATSGYFACPTAYLRELPASVEGFKILLEVIVWWRLRRVIEVPYVFRDRQIGKSKLGLRVSRLYLQQLVTLYRGVAARNRQQSDDVVPVKSGYRDE